jgi:hypothetical protein
VKLAESSDKTLRKQLEEETKASVLREADVKQAEAAVEVAEETEVKKEIEELVEVPEPEDVTVKIEPEVKE